MEHGVIMKTLDWAYDKAMNGLPGTSSAMKFAEEYMGKPGTVSSQVDSLIRWQTSKSATSGFITGLGGIVTLPVSIPANIASVLYVQCRMVAAIAYIGGYDIRSDQVKTMVYACLCGNAVGDLLKDAGVQIGVKLSQQAIKKISGGVIKKINKAVGFRLVTKFGQTGVVNLGKAVPVVGGIIGGTWDGVATRTIGKVAKKLFISDSVVSA